MSKFKVGDKVILTAYTIDDLESKVYSYTLMPLHMLLRIHTVSYISDSSRVFILEGRDWFREYELEHASNFTEFELIMRGIKCE